jgi:hypothetical protein
MSQTINIYISEGSSTLQQAAASREQGIPEPQNFAGHLEHPHPSVVPSPVSIGELNSSADSAGVPTPLSEGLASDMTTSDQAPTPTMGLSPDHPLASAVPEPEGLPLPRSSDSEVPVPAADKPQPKRRTSRKSVSSRGKSAK